MSANFTIPISQEELLLDTSGQYVVEKVLDVLEIGKALKVAAKAYRDLGPAYILSSFDPYFSVVYHSMDMTRLDVHFAFEEIKKCLKAIPNEFSDYFEENVEISEEKKEELQNILKMILYLYVSLFHCLERPTSDSILDGKKKKTDSAQINVDWTHTVSALNRLFQLDLKKFWDGSTIDSMLLTKVIELPMFMLENQKIKQKREAQTELWAFCGLLMNVYGATNTLVLRFVRLLKEHEYAVPLLTDFTTHIMNVYNEKSFLSNFIIELTEWQINEKNGDSSGVKNCCKLVLELAAAMPHYMSAMLGDLEKFLRMDSPQLRSMVLGIQAEVLITGVRNEASLEEKEKEEWRLLRNSIFTVMEMFTHDITASVRAKVFGYIVAMMQENVLPTQTQQLYLDLAVKHLRDNVATVRKAASQCVTSILQNNTFGHQLSLAKKMVAFEKNREELRVLKCEFHAIDKEKLAEMDRAWETEHLPHLLKEVHSVNFNRIDEEVEESEHSEEEEMRAPRRSTTADATAIQDHNISSTVSPKSGSSTNSAPGEVILIENVIQQEINEKNYKAAVSACLKAVKISATYKAMRTKMEQFSDIEFVIFYMHIVYSNLLADGVKQPTIEQLIKLSDLEKNLEYLNDVIVFLSSMKNAMGHQIVLLNSANITDMQEAIQFIIAAQQFRLDDATDGINAILKILLRTEEDRKKHACDAMKTLFLVTDSTSLLGHTREICDRLIKLQQTVPVTTSDAFAELLCLWAKQGTLGNDIIDTLWGYFLKKYDNTKQESLAALSLLRLIAEGRPSIVELNHHVVTTVCLSERFDEPLLVTEGLDMLVMRSRTSKGVDDDAAFRLDRRDGVWKQLLKVCMAYRTHKSPFVNNLLMSAVRFIFALNSQPFQCAEQLLKIYARRSETGDWEIYLAVRYNIVVSEILGCMLDYLDLDVYKELKRRQQIKAEKKKQKQPTKSKTSSSSSLDISATRSRSNLNATVDGDTSLVGAEAVDEDADYIMYVLENSITSGTYLGNLLADVLHVCKSPLKYKSDVLQVAAVTALARGMLMSTVFCENHALLLFSVLFGSKYTEVKKTILIHIVDMLDRCPNVIEPYTPKLYKLLADPNTEIRSVTLNTLSLLILKDMIRPQGDIWRLAACLVDPVPSICSTARSFFLQSTDKSNNLYNYMPDIFTSISEKFPRESEDKENADPNGDEPEVGSNEHKFRYVMTHLLHLIDKPKHIEQLVERFCLKFEHADDEFAKRIAFALSLLQYNDKALSKLIDSFQKYKNFVINGEVYAWFKRIFEMCKGKGLKDLTVQLEELVNDIFKVTGRTQFKPPPAKRGRGRKAGAIPAAAKRVAKKRASSGSDNEVANVTASKSTRGRSRRLTTLSSESDSDEEPTRRRSARGSRRRN